METLKNNSEEYDNIWKSQSDVDDWFLMSTPYPILAIITAYLLFVLKLGPSYMKKREPFNLNRVILIYNFVQVLFASYLVYIGSVIIYKLGIVQMECKLDHKTVLAISAGTYFYFSSKVTELLDTIFFVLRKKDNQVTFLHVYHHCIVVLATWWALKYEISYTPVFLGTLNSFVHVVMYSYYALSTFPSLTKYLWWKKYITKLQLGQFVMILIQITANYLYTGCPPSYFLFSMIVVNVILMIVLFSNFYIKSYSKGKIEKARREKKEAIRIKNELNNNINNNNNKVHQKVK